MTRRNEYRSSDDGGDDDVDDGGDDDVDDDADDKHLHS